MYRGIQLKELTVILPLYTPDIMGGYEQEIVEAMLLAHKWGDDTVIYDTIEGIICDTIEDESQEVGYYYGQPFVDLYDKLGLLHTHYLLSYYDDGYTVIHAEIWDSSTLMLILYLC